MEITRETGYETGMSNDSGGSQLLSTAKVICKVDDSLADASRYLYRCL